MATGNGRNKAILKPGHSLADWIRLCNSGTDLTGLKGELLEITPQELARHNTEDDCWIVLNGSVYDVSKYLDFHPGGIEQLMRGSGKDATDLFEATHSWVNYKGLLSKCLVGHLKPGTVAEKAI